MFTYLEIKEEERYSLLTINRPKQLNALNLALLKELKQWLVNNQESKKILILTGSGDRAFVAGADIAEMKDMTPKEAESFSQLGQETISLIYNWPLPTIAAINGFALGGGCELALACDLRFIKEEAIIGQPEIGLGIIPGFGGTYLLKNLLGEALAKDLIFSGRQLKALEAVVLGLVHKVLPAEGFLSNVLESTKGIIYGSPSALLAAKKSLNEEGISKELEKERAIFSELFDSDDQKEGMNAFLEKRRPNFKYY